MVATTITQNGDDVDVVAKMEAGARLADPSAMPEITLEDLKNLRVITPSGSVLIGSLLAPAGAATAGS